MVDIKELNDRNIGGAEFFTNSLQQYMRNEFGSIKTKIDDMEKFMTDDNNDQVLDFMFNGDKELLLSTEDELNKLPIGERAAAEVDERKL